MIKHHVIPRFYLDNFTNEEGKLWTFPNDSMGKPKSPKMTSVIKRYNQLYPICQAKPFGFEEYYQSIESPAAPVVVKTIDQLQVPTGKDSAWLMAFLANLGTRTPTARKEIEADIECLLDGFPLKEWMKSKGIIKNLTLYHTHEYSMKLFWKLASRAWQLVKPGDPAHAFVTSMKPVTAVDFNGNPSKSFLTLLNIEMRIVCPLSNQVGIQTRRNDEPTIKMLNQVEVTQFNNWTRFGAAEFYSSVKI